MSWLSDLGSSALDLFTGLPSASTARALALAIAPIAGGVPQTMDYPDYSEVVFTPDQEERVAAWLGTQLRAEPGPVRVDMSGIALKVLAREYWPWFVGLTLAGGLAGYAMRGAR